MKILVLETFAYAKKQDRIAKVIKTFKPTEIKKELAIQKDKINQYKIAQGLCFRKFSILFHSFKIF